MKMLEINNLQVNYGPVIAVKKVDLFVNQGETVVLLGANGAGKSSTLLSIAGVANKLLGKVKFSGKDITKFSPEKILTLGIATVPENRDIFPDLSVKENLVLGGYINRKKNNILQDTIEEVYNLFPILSERNSQVAGTLSGGEQQMLAIGRALMSKPKILLLDEPSLGLAPTIVEKIYEHIEQLKKDTNLTILLVEQHAMKALSIADRVYFLRLGEIVSSGKASDLKEKTDFKKIYFGE
jgi:branched-chain amino acid transport system ATP-binding protein|tara:strand:- start:4504 stop:5220 length:717 start_codon:yes stop_codon:yes gene_type:complete